MRVCGETARVAPTMAFLLWFRNVFCIHFRDCIRRAATASPPDILPIEGGKLPLSLRVAPQARSGSVNRYASINEYIDVSRLVENAVGAQRQEAPRISSVA